MSGQEYSYRGKLKDSNISGHVSLGAQYSLTKNLSLSVYADYAFAKLKDFTGTLMDRNGTGTEMLLTTARDELGEMLSISPTAEPLPQGYRPAEIDLSGFKFSIGLKFICEKCRNRDDNEEVKPEEQDKEKKCEGDCGGPKRRGRIHKEIKGKCDKKTLEKYDKEAKILAVVRATKDCMRKAGEECRCVGGKLVKRSSYAKPIKRKDEVWDKEKKKWVEIEVDYCEYRCSYWYKEGKCKKVK
jgi:hypothetical protein